MRKSPPDSTHQPRVSRLLWIHPKCLPCTDSVQGYLDKLTPPCAVPALVDEAPPNLQQGAEPTSTGSSQQSPATAIAPMKCGWCGSPALCRVKVHHQLSQPVPPTALWTHKQLKDSWNVTQHPIAFKPLERLNIVNEISLIFKQFVCDNWSCSCPGGTGNSSASPSPMAASDPYAGCGMDLDCILPSSCSKNITKTTFVHSV